MSFKTKLMMGAILIGCGPFHASISYAQDEPSSSGFDTIVVTATKKGEGESVQEVPLSVTAFDGDLIEKLQIRNVQDVSYSAPNIALDSSGTVKGLQNFSIRGLGTVSSVPGIDPTVGTFVDGIYLGTNFGVILDTFDLESIEVLRGPQGVLFGRNVTGGAVVTNTRKASHDNSAKIRVGIESGPQYSVAASVNGTIIEDVLAGKLVGFYKRDEGFFTNLFNGNNNFGGDETFMFRGAFNLTPAPGIDIDLRLETGSIQGDGIVNQNRVFAQGFNVNVNEEGSTDLTWNSATLEANIDTDFGDGVITTIAGYRETNNTSITEFDGRPMDIFGIAFRIDQSQWSAETRYSGSFFDGRWETTAGLYFFTQDIIYREERGITGLFLGPGGAFVPLAGGLGVRAEFGGDQGQNTYGVFSSNDFAVTNALTLNIGARYTFEEKDAQITAQALNIPGGAQPCEFLSNDPCSGVDFNEAEEFNNFSPRVGFQYKINDDTQVYGSWSRGFRSGGFNLRTTTPVATTDASAVDDEIQSAFEVGIKGDFFNDRVRTNIALYHSDVDGLQRAVTPVDGPSAGAQLIENTADVTLKGVEVEASVLVTDNFTWNGFFGIIDSEFDDILFDLNNDGVLNDADFDLELPLLAKYSAGTSIDYRYEFQNGELGLNATYGYRSRAASDDANTPTTFQNERHIINASLAYTSEDGKWTAAIYGKNLANELIFQTINIVNGITQSGNDGGAISTPQKGRVIGAEITVNF